MQLKQTHPVIDRLRAYPPMVTLIYVLAAYVVVLSLTSLIPAIEVRLQTGTWLTGGNQEDPLYEFGTSFGFWGAIFFTIGMVLSTRAKFLERLFGGLDKMYRIHAFSGKIALLFIGAHFVLVVLQGFPDATLTREYLVPGVNLSYTLGLFGTLALIGLVALTLWVKIPYHSWLQTHRWMGLPFLAGTAHAIILQGDWYMWGMTLLGGAAWIHMLFFYERVAPQQSGVVAAIRRDGGIQDITLQLNEPLAVQAGQFVFLSVTQSREKLPREQHPFSISGVLDTKTIRISVKTLGDYTRQLQKLVQGDQIKIFGPYGQFGNSVTSSTQPMLWIAGGIGITPFLALLEAEQQHTQSRPAIYFLWSVKREEDAVYLDQIRKQVEALPHVQFALHVSDRDGFLSANDLTRLFDRESLQGIRAFLCGPIPMMRSVRRHLKQAGLLESDIVSEEFALR
jgi:predicted ferric reductase